MNSELQPGLLVLHGNRAEWLAEAVFEWLQQHPLLPLEEEIFLVQSNGVAEWLKTTLAAHAGICAATRVELPARFLWRAYRQWLGHDAVPAQSALDKLPLTWRLMALLPTLLPRPGFEPLAGFLRDGDAGRRLQLAQRLADLYDQYQVYRPSHCPPTSAGRRCCGANCWRRCPSPSAPPSGRDCTSVSCKRWLPVPRRWPGFRAVSCSSA